MAADSGALLDGPATAILEALERRETTAAELCAAAIARIEQRDAAINAVVVRDFARALEAARAADAARARGASGRLLGLPMTVKESFDVAGLPTTWGLEPARERRAQHDAVAVERLKAAGAVILGKTNVSSGLADWQADNPIYGRTVHPLDARRTPGGSSGGAAAALAARMVPLELGSDIGGSIRVPAHFCGVFGHKPSHGLVPRRGHDFPGSAGGAPDPLLDVGPMARSARDLELALAVLAGPDDDQALGYRLALPPPRHARIGSYRVRVLRAHRLAAVSAAVGAAIERAAAGLARAGCRIDEGDAGLPDLAAAHEAFVRIMMTVITRADPGGRPPISSHQWLDLLDRRQALRAQWRGFFNSTDAVLAPVLGVTAFAHVAEPDWRKRTLELDGRSVAFAPQVFWAGIATLPGLPATVAPAGKDEAGLPVGVQIIGPYLEDHTTLTLAGFVETLG